MSAFRSVLGKSNPGFALQAEAKVIDCVQLKLRDRSDSGMDLPNPMSVSFIVLTRNSDNSLLLLLCLTYKLTKRRVHTFRGWIDGKLVPVKPKKLDGARCCVKSTPFMFLLPVASRFSTTSE